MTTYADRINGVETSLAIKTPARLATTGNITLSGVQAIDGVVAAVGDRVLVWQQSDPKQNGIWDVSTIAWTRSIDMNGARDLARGTHVYVTDGVSHEGMTFIVSTVSPVVGTTAINFVADSTSSTSTQFTPNQFITTAAVQTYSTGTAGALNVTATNHVLFGTSPAGPQTYGVDYTVSGGAITFLFPVLGNELYTVLSMPRFTNSEAQVILQDYVDALTATTLTTIQGFGLGVTSGPPQAANLDDATRATGAYTVLDTATGVFPEAAEPGILLMDRYSAGWVRQIFTYRGDDATVGGRTYVRTTTSLTPTWGPWRRLLGFQVGQAFGYDANNGGAVTQITSRTTGVTLNKPSGRITMFSAAGSLTPASFTLTNSTITDGDTITFGRKGGSNLYLFTAEVAAGSAVITFVSLSGTAVDAPIINFAVIKTSGT